MEPGKPSSMAEGTALFRAAHQVIDDDPKILVDPLAIPMLGTDRDEIEADRKRHLKPTMAQGRAFVVMRSRYTEDELAASVDRGVTQYVVLGAGLDTSAYRPGHVAEKLRTFEIDHPDTQRWKLDRLRQAGIAMPKNLRHIPVDFERQSLAEELEKNGFDPNQPTFFSWLGVVYYLELESALQTFRYIAARPAGSQVVFDFMLDDASIGPAKAASVQRAGGYLESIGEPWTARFSPGELEKILRDIGFSQVTYFSNALAHERYLAGRSDGLSLDDLNQMMSAIV